MQLEDRERCAVLCDELIRRGVPAELVRPAAEWLDRNNPALDPGTVSVSYKLHVYRGTDQLLLCIHCGLPFSDGLGPCRG